MSPVDPAVYKQLDYLGEVLTQMEDRMIDPIDYGELKGSVNALKGELHEVKQRQQQIDAKLDLVLDKLSEARGGWKLLMLLGGAAATLGAGITWFATHTITVGPKG